MTNAATFIGAPRNFNNKLKIYPPSVATVVADPNFNVFYKVLTLSQDDVKDELKGKVKLEEMPTPFEYLLASAQYIKGFS